MWAVGLNTFREAMRNRVLAVLVLFAVGLMAFSLVLGELSLHEEIRVIKDIGLAGISLVGVVIALFLGVNLLSKELDKKTVYFVIPKPLHRWEFLLGKYLGLSVTLALLVVLMAVTLAMFVGVQGGHHGIAMIRAEVLVLLELQLLIAVAILFSSFSSPYLSAMFTGALWVIGRNTLELRTFAGGKLEGTPVGALLDLVTRTVPDFHVFYISGASLGASAQGDAGAVVGDRIVSIHDTFVSWVYVAEAALYCGLYAGTCLLIAIVLFSRRDFT
jgi:ABC-type transport system involved in multi-copper enzyme maturation permease subunit